MRKKTRTAPRGVWVQLGSDFSSESLVPLLGVELARAPARRGG